MSKNKHAQKVAKRVFSPPRAGDPGPHPELDPYPTRQYPVELVNPEALDTLSNSDLFTLALQVGVNPAKLTGMPNCKEHFAARSTLTPLTEAFTHSEKYSQYQYGIDILWCNGCMAWYRERKPLC